MRIFIGVMVMVALALAGLIVNKAVGRHNAPAAATGRLATSEPVATITVGERADIEAAVPRDGYTIVEFTADF